MRPSFIIVSKEAIENVDTPLALHRHCESEEERLSVGERIEKTSSPICDTAVGASKVHINWTRTDGVLRAFKSAGALSQVLHYIQHEHHLQELQ